MSTVKGKLEREIFYADNYKLVLYSALIKNAYVFGTDTMKSH